MDKKIVAQRLVNMARRLVAAGVERTFACGSAGYCTLTWTAPFTFDETLDGMKKYSDAAKSAAGYDMKALPRNLASQGVDIEMRSTSKGPTLHLVMNGNLPGFIKSASFKMPDGTEATVRETLKKFGFKKR